MDELVRKEDVIDIIKKTIIGDAGFDYGKDRAIEMIEELPSAFPELDEWCDDCKEYDAKHCSCPRYNRIIRSALEELKNKDADWSYNEDTKQVTLVVPQNVYDSATTIFLSIGYEGSFGLRGRVFA